MLPHDLARVHLRAPPLRSTAAAPYPPPGVFLLQVYSGAPRVHGIELTDDRRWQMAFDEGVAADADLAGWIQRAVDFVVTLPPK